jgi:hypothetical protein
MSHFVDDKAEIHHYEGDVSGLDKGKDGFVADTEAADYVDPTLVITPEENSRLKRKVFKK